MLFKTYVCKPLQRPSVQGRHLDQIFEVDRKAGTKKMIGSANRTKALDINGESLPEIVQVVKNVHDRSRYQAGLSKMIENPFKEDRKSVV